MAAFKAKIVALIFLWELSLWAHALTPTLLHSSGTLDDVFGEAFISQSVHTDSCRLRIGVRLARVVAGKILDFTEERNEFVGINTKPGDKEVYLRSMNIGDSEVTNALVEAKNKGAGKVAVIIDGQTGFNVEGDGRFDLAKLKKSKMGKAIEKLLDVGFTINEDTARYGIYFAKFASANSMRPLQHEKGLTLVSRNCPIPSLAKLRGKWQRFRRVYLPYFGGVKPFETETQISETTRVLTYLLTDNFTERAEQNLVFNRMLEVLNHSLASHDLAHVQKMIEAFSDEQGGKISDIESLPPLQLIFDQDGSMVELDYGNGRKNLNDRMLPLFEEEDLLEVVASHYVMSMDSFVEAMEDGLINNPNLRIFAAVDSQFVNPAKSGLVGVLAGFPAKGDRGVVLPGILSSLRQRIKAWVAQKRDDVREETDDQESQDGKLLHHDKLTVFRTSKWIHVFVGSANLGDAKHNAEYQLYLKFPVSSKFGRSFIQSVKNLVKKRRDLWVPLSQAVFRNTLAEFLMMPPSDLSMRTLYAIEGRLKVNDFDGALTLAREMTQDNSEEITARFELLRTFFDWYQTKVWPRKVFGRTGKRFHIPVISNMVSWVLDRVLPNRHKISPQQITPIESIIRLRGNEHKNFKGYVLQSVLHSMQLEETDLSSDETKDLIEDLLRRLHIDAQIPSADWNREMKKLEARRKRFLQTTGCDRALSSKGIYCLSSDSS